MKGCLVTWRHGSGTGSCFVAPVHGAAGPGGVEIRMAGEGVRVDGTFIAPGRAARVGGVVLSCLQAELITRDFFEARLGRMVGAAVSSIEVMHQVAAAGLTREPVLVLGESGTGKELVAECLGCFAGGMHAVNLGAVPAELAEAELFGWTRGAFTGAIDSREGALEAARDGVLFLDELGEAPSWVQAKLLRAIDSGRFRRLGATRDSTLGARVVAATNVDPAEGVADGRLRLDLLERLGCHVVRLSPLRSRPADIPGLVRRFAQRHAGQDGWGGAIAPASADVIDLMRRWPWPGNVRELSNVVSRVLLVSASGLTDVGLVRDTMEAGMFMAPAAPVPGPCPETTRHREICDSGIPRSTYYYRLKRGKIPNDTGPRRAPSSAALKI